MTDACYFVNLKPFKEDLEAIFAELDTDKDGFITIQEYIDFIRKYLGRGLNMIEPPTIESPKKE